MGELDCHPVVWVVLDLSINPNFLALEFNQFKVLDVILPCSITTTSRKASPLTNRPLLKTTTCFVLTVINGPMIINVINSTKKTSPALD
jgi:hypothetical protein